MLTCLARIAPDGKQQHVEALEQAGKTVMVGSSVGLHKVVAGVMVLLGATATFIAALNDEKNK